MRKFCILVAAFFALIAQPALARDLQEIGRIKNVTAGGVEVIRSGDKLRAQSGFQLREGDIVVTQRGQRVGITFIDNTRMAVSPGSRVIISSYRFQRANEADRAEMLIERGTVGVDSGDMPRSGDMRFRTPTSTLGVRGTSFVIEVDG